MGLREKYSSDNPANRMRPGWVFTYQHPAHMLALFFGAGCLRPGPGTWGTLAGVIVWAFLVQFFDWKALLPIIIGNVVGVSGLAIGGTSVIIVVGVALETVRALESQMMMRQYKGFLE